MAELPQNDFDSPKDTDAGLDPGLATGTPRWVYVFALIALALILLFVIVHLAGGGLGGHAPR